MERNLYRGVERSRRYFSLALLLPAMLFTAGNALAHCDGMDGPVVKAAQKALETENLKLVLVWVQKSDEPEIAKAFESTVAVRKLNAAARELADRYFFETLVRVHRAGEGAAYTGLKPAGRDLGPALPAADRAVENRSINQLRELLSRGLNHGLDERFGSLIAKKNLDADDLTAGREFVKAYVEFVHYVEQVHLASTAAAHGHFSDPGETPTPRHEH